MATLNSPPSITAGEIGTGMDPNRLHQIKSPHLSNLEHDPYVAQDLWDRHGLTNLADTLCPELRQAEDWSTPDGENYGAVSEYVELEAQFRDNRRPGTGLKNARRQARENLKTALREQYGENPQDIENLKDVFAGLDVVVDRRTEHVHEGTTRSRLEGWNETLSKAMGNKYVKWGSYTVLAASIGAAAFTGGAAAAAGVGLMAGSRKLGFRGVRHAVSIDRRRSGKKVRQATNTLETRVDKGIQTEREFEDILDAGLDRVAAGSDAHRRQETTEMAAAGLTFAAGIGSLAFGMASNLDDFSIGGVEFGEYDFGGDEVGDFTETDQGLAAAASSDSGQVVEPFASNGVEGAIDGAGDGPSTDELSGSDRVEANRAAILAGLNDAGEGVDSGGSEELSSETPSHLQNLPEVAGDGPSTDELSGSDRVEANRAAILAGLNDAGEGVDSGDSAESWGDTARRQLDAIEAAANGEGVDETAEASQASTDTDDFIESDQQQAAAASLDSGQVVEPFASNSVEATGGDAATAPAEQAAVEKVAGQAETYHVAEGSGAGVTNVMDQFSQDKGIEWSREIDASTGEPTADLTPEAAGEIYKVYDSNEFLINQAAEAQGIKVEIPDFNDPTNPEAFDVGLLGGADFNLDVEVTDGDGNTVNLADKLEADLRAAADQMQSDSPETTDGFDTNDFIESDQQQAAAASLDSGQVVEPFASNGVEAGESAGAETTDTSTDSFITTDQQQAADASSQTGQVVEPFASNGVEATGGDVTDRPNQFEGSYFEGSQEAEVPDGGVGFEIGSGPEQNGTGLIQAVEHALVESGVDPDVAARDAAAVYNDLASADTNPFVEAFGDIGEDPNGSLYDVKLASGDIDWRISPADGTLVFDADLVDQISASHDNVVAEQAAAAAETAVDNAANSTEFLSAVNDQQQAAIAEALGVTVDQLPDTLGRIEQLAGVFGVDIDWADVDPTTLADTDPGVDSANSILVRFMSDIKNIGSAFSNIS